MARPAFEKTLLAEIQGGYAQQRAAEGQPPA